MVEDDRTINDALAQRLVAEGYVVDQAFDGPSAVDLARLTEPDVVLLDYRMPGRNGIEIATEILAEDPDQHVLLFSAYFDDDIVAEAARIGVRECVSKDHAKAIPDILRKYCSPN